MWCKMSRDGKSGICPSSSQRYSCWIKLRLISKSSSRRNCVTKAEEDDAVEEERDIVREKTLNNTSLRSIFEETGFDRRPGAREQLENDY